MLRREQDYQVRYAISPISNANLGHRMSRDAPSKDVVLIAPRRVATSTGGDSTKRV
jgi:hypothetical protein